MIRRLLLTFTLVLPLPSVSKAQELIQSGRTTDGGFHTYQMPNGDKVTYIYGPRGVTKYTEPAPKTAAQVFNEAKAAKLARDKAKGQRMKPALKPYVPMSAAQGGLDFGNRPGDSNPSPFQVIYGGPR